ITRGMAAPASSSAANASMNAGWSLPRLVKMYSTPNSPANCSMREAAVVGDLESFTLGSHRAWARTPGRGRSIDRHACLLDYRRPQLHLLGQETPKFLRGTR